MHNNLIHHPAQQAHPDNQLFPSNPLAPAKAARLRAGAQAAAAPDQRAPPLPTAGARRRLAVPQAHLCGLEDAPAGVEERKKKWY